MSLAVDRFNIVIQAGAIIAVLGLYRMRVNQMVHGLLGRDDAGRRLALQLMVAFAPAAVLGPLLDSRIEAYLFNPGPVIAALFVGGVLMLVLAAFFKARPERLRLEVEQLTYKAALLIGLAQCFAMWPGTSRSMMTIVAALLLGFRPWAAAEIAFLLGLITLGAATVYKSVQGGEQMLEQLGMLNIAVGLVAATISAALAVHWFVKFLTRKGLAPFGWYRLALSALLMLLVSNGALTF